MKPIPVASPNIRVDDPGSASQLGLAGIDVFRCEDCGHLQLLDMLEPHFQYTNFQYTTSVSRGLDAHLEGLGAELIRRVGTLAGKSVLEIGSNDGTLLEVLHKAGARVLGIDPAEKAAGLANARGLETIVGFFSAETGQKILQTHGKFDLVLSNYTVANIDDLTGFAAGVNLLLADDGLLVVETSYGLDVLQSRLLDTIYHEHVSYFLVTALQVYAQRSGWELVDVQHIPTKGGSIRVYFRRAAARAAVSSAVGQFVGMERAADVAGTRPYAAFMHDLEMIEKELATFVVEHRARGPIVAFGSAVGSMPLMSQFNLWPAIDLFADDTPLAKTLVHGDKKIEVLPTAALAARQPGAIVLLAWRYADKIKESLQKAGVRDVPVIVPFPAPHRFTT